MRLAVIDSLSMAGNTCNEDRLGIEGACAWIIDGATDVLELPLLPGPSDAAWFADALHGAIARHAARTHVPSSAPDLDALLLAVTADVAERFGMAAARPPSFRHEKPSAAGIVACFSEDRVHALSLGDCTLARFRSDGGLDDLFRAHGVRDADEDLRAAVASLQAADPEPVDPPKATLKGIRAGLMPRLRAARDLMNTPEGYGVFSIDPPPAALRATADLPVSRGDRFLLATDGFMRLVDVYGAYGWDAFGPALEHKGLCRLAVELRDIETADAHGTRHPRAKSRDDATAMILEVV